MTREQLVGRLRIVEGDLAFGRYSAALYEIARLIDEAKAEGAPRRSPLADLPRGVRVTVERVDG